MSVAALIPAHDEEPTVARTVETVLGLGRVDRLLVIDDGSSDATAAEAAMAGAETLRLPANQGKGAALQAGLEHLGRTPEVLLLLDADLGTSASEACSLLEPIEACSADMTIATFPPPPGKAGFGLVKGLARTGIARLGGGFQTQAPLSGQRALTRRAVDAAVPFATGYGVEIALTVRVLRAGLTVVEVPTTMTHTHSGRDLSGFAHRGRQFVHVATALLDLARDRSALVR